MKALLPAAPLGLAPALLTRSQAAETPAAAPALGSRSADSSKSAEAWAQKNLEGWQPKTMALGVELDVLEQTVDYRVPVGKIADLLRYNGSLVIDRTRGELSAHCDSEQQNMIALNIADDIVKGERNVEQALAYHAQIIVGLRDGEPETYPQNLRFKAVSSTADAGEEAPLLVHLGD